MTPAYIPQPGTIQARAIAHLHTSPQCGLVPNALLAEQLDVDPVDLAKAMHTAFERGAVSRETRDRQPWWGIGHAGLRHLSAPLAVSADDDVDDAPLVQRTVPASRSGGVSLVDVPAWSPPKETAMPVPSPTPPQATKPKKAWNAAPAFDPLKIEVKKDRPMPPMLRGPGSVSPYKVLLDRLKPGESVDLPKAAAKSLMGVAKKSGIKIACRVLDETTTGVWKL
jgi:hypothetical protein